MIFRCHVIRFHIKNEKIVSEQKQGRKKSYTSFLVQQFPSKSARDVSGEKISGITKTSSCDKLVQQYLDHFSSSLWKDATGTTPGGSLLISFETSIPCSWLFED